nr:S8 family serine peptidase [Campylobacterota bacterium]
FGMVFMVLSLNYLYGISKDNLIDENKYKKLILKKGQEARLLNFTKTSFTSFKNTILSSSLKKVLELSPYDKHYVKDNDSLNLLVSLNVDYSDIDFKYEKPNLIIESHIDSAGVATVYHNNKRVTTQQIEKKNSQIKNYLKRIRLAKESRNQKALQDFIKKNNMNASKLMTDALGDGKTFFEVKLKKNEINNFILKNQKLLKSVEFPMVQEDELASAMISSKVDPYAFDQNRQGLGVGIFMHEANNKCPAASFLDRYTRLDGGGQSTHSDYVASILRGVSPRAHIYCRSNGFLPTSSDLNNHLILVENHSYGTRYSDPLAPYHNEEYLTYDKDFDNHIYDTDIIVFKSAGNNGSNNNNPLNVVTSPGKALNVITVGSYNENSEAIADHSSYINPETKNEKPELTAPGTSINIPAVDELNHNGTSFASPHAAGLAADLISKYIWMDKAAYFKAILLAGSTQNISDVNSYQDSRIGVGGIDFHNSVFGSQNRYYYFDNNDYSYYASNDGGTNNTALEWKVNVSAGKETRVAIAWLSRGDYIYSHKGDSHPIGMDFDLYVYAPDGSFLGSSSSWDNPYELVDFTAPTTGEYTIRINRYANRDTDNDIRMGVSVNWK